MGRIRLTLALTGVIGTSAIVELLAARRIGGLWILPDEAIYGARGLEVWRAAHLSVVRGAGAGYSVLYPLLAGAALSIGTPATGYALLKFVQAVVVSLTAMPVFLYARRMMPEGWALVAAALSLASPIVLYAGFVMTEVLFYPLAAWALLAVARAVASGTPRDQYLALALIAASVLTRTQGVVLIGVFALAVLVDAAAGRDLRRLRSFVPVWIAFGTAVLAALTTPGVLGAYAETLRTHYSFGGAAGLAWDHFAYLALSTGVAPVAALALLTMDMARGRLRDEEHRALVAVVGAAVLLVVAQVGIFASSYAPHLLGRDLAALPPLLFVALALWLSGTRNRIATLAVAAAEFGVLAATPWSQLLVPAATPDSFGLVILEPHRQHAALAIAAAVLVLLVVLRGRLLVLVPLAVFVVLAASTVAASNQIAKQARYDQVNLVGSDHRWVDHAADGPVAELYDGERYWNGVWQTTFWNRRISQVISLAPTLVPGPIAQHQVPAPADGRLPVSDPYILASDPHTFVGTAVAHLQQNGLDVSGLTLWRLDPPARLATIARGIQVNGDMSEPGRLTAYDCAGGRLELTLLPKTTRVVTIWLDGHIAARATIGGLDYWNGAIPVPRSPTPRVCHFVIQGQALLGSTRILFHRPSP